MKLYLVIETDRYCEEERIIKAFRKEENAKRFFKKEVNRFLNDDRTALDDDDEGYEIFKSENNVFGRVDGIVWWQVYIKKIEVD